MAPPQWAYQVENFVTKPDDELVCSVCHAVFCDPVICPCDHVFCRQCITKWLQNNRNCPICRKRVPRYSIKQMVPIVKNLIMKLTMACKNKENGCEAQFTLEGCEAHMKECQFELVQCKNKPCSEKLFRKDIEEHEKNGCPHRYIKCKKCNVKMPSSIDPSNHDCIRELQLLARRKSILIKKKNEKIKALRNEIKALKETSAGSIDSVVSRSTGSSRSPEIMINFAELDSLSSITSDSDASSENSIIAIIADGPFGRSDGNGESFASHFDDNEYTVEYPRTESPLDLSEYRNAEAQTVNDFPSNENHNDSHDRDENAENDSTAAETVEEREERSQQRRPTKRRLPPPILSTSDDDNNESEGHPSLPSPKRCWRLPSEEEDVQFEVIGDGDEDSSNSGMEAGPSSKCTSVEEPKQDKSSSSTKWRFRSKAQKHAKEENSRKTASGSRSAPQGGNAVFERTLALLEQYNLESDPEWLPQYASHRGDTTSESDTSCSYDEEMDDTNSSLSDSDYFNGEDSNATDLLHGLYESTSEDDPDWRPVNVEE